MYPISTQSPVNRLEKCIWTAFQGEFPCLDSIVSSRPELPFVQWRNTGGLLGHFHCLHNSSKQPASSSWRERQIIRIDAETHPGRCKSAFVTVLKFPLFQFADMGNKALFRTFLINIKVCMTRIRRESSPQTASAASGKPLNKKGQVPET